MVGENFVEKAAAAAQPSPSPGPDLEKQSKKNRGESWRELFYRTTAAAAARWWWGATLFLCLSGKAIHAGGKPGCTHCSWLFQVQIRDDDQNSMSTGFSLCLLFFWTEQKNCLRRKSRQGSAGHNKRWAKISKIQKKSLIFQFGVKIQMISIFSDFP